MLFKIFNLFVETFKAINIVEYWKTICWITYNKKLFIMDEDFEKCKKIKGIAIDLFIVIKYLFILSVLFGVLKTNNIFFYIIWYLIIMNIFTYFYYHIWENKKIGKEASKKRFLNFILSIIYSSLSFMTLYKYYYTHDFEISNIYSISDTVRAFSLSFGSFLNINNIFPATDKGYIVFSVNCTINFIFLTFILMNTNVNCEEE